MEMSKIILFLFIMYSYLTELREITFSKQIALLFQSMSEFTECHLTNNSQEYFFCYETILGYEFSPTSGSKYLLIILK